MNGLDSINSYLVTKLGSNQFIVAIIVVVLGSWSLLVVVVPLPAVGILGETMCLES